MSKRVPDWATKSEFNESVGQSVFISSIGRWVSLYSYFKSSMDQWVPDRGSNIKFNESVSQFVFKS